MGSIKKAFDLTGKSALVTGGSRGLGLQIAEALGEQGARIVLSSRKDADLKQAQEHLAGLGIKSDWIAADNAKDDDIKRLADEAIANDEGHTRGGRRRQTGGECAIASYRRPGRSEGRSGLVRKRRRQTHHGTDTCRRRWFDCCLVFCLIPIFAWTRGWPVVGLFLRTLPGKGHDHA
jgi:NAD(P)-dependent dehydrogenase (short-subunit alcohol dehydrogenase family)